MTGAKENNNMESHTDVLEISLKPKKEEKNVNLYLAHIFVLFNFISLNNLNLSHFESFEPMVYDL
jgi:hypothetical protein